MTGNGGSSSNSLEGVYGLIHGLIDGQMGEPATVGGLLYLRGFFGNAWLNLLPAFDLCSTPFHFHHDHCNVDHLMPLWCVVNPGVRFPI